MHAKLLLNSSLANTYEMFHFEAGSPGGQESTLSKLKRTFLSPLSLIHFLWRHKPNIVHINTGLDSKAYWRDLVYLIVSKMLGVRVVNQIHGGPLPQDFFSNSRMLTELLRWTLRKSDAVSVLSGKEYEAYKLFSPEVLTVWIPNAIDPIPLLGSIAEPDIHQPLSLIYVGRLVREKGLFELLEAIARLKIMGKTVFLDVAGAGQSERELKAAVSTLGLDENVYFHGPVFGAEKNRLWQKADIFAFPTYHEGLPYSLLEAMAAGTPAITCPVGAIPDVIQDGVHGFFVPPRNVDAIEQAINTLDNDRSLLNKMAHNSRERVLENYTLKRLAKDFSHLYETVLKSQ